MSIETFYERMYKIRAFEKNLLSLFSDNKLFGTTHTYIGQEAVAVAAMNNIGENDCVFSNHRCHGHFIAYSNNIKVLLAEIMGKKDGMCRGRGGSQHICYRNFFTNGIQGGIVPDATGIAFAEKIKGNGSVTMAFIGDGTLGQGVVYESFNMASLYDIPIIYVVEDNGYAMTTKTSNGVAGSIVVRARSFGIEASEITSNDVLELDEEFKKAFDYVRTTGRPYCQVVHTYRLGPHSKGDDFRDPEEIAEHQKNDPLLLAEKKMSELTVKEIREKVNAEIADATEFCSKLESESIPCLDDSDVDDVLSNKFDSLLNADEHIKCVTSLNRGLKNLLADNPDILIMGEDICDPYGGSFKATRGLSTEFSNRVLNTPISEAGFIGMAVGMAMRGMRPIVDLMFGDFISLGFDQILNHASKFEWMYASQVKVPLLIRAPMGGGRGYGATHSQTLEKYYIGIPNIRVLAISTLLNVEKLLTRIENTIDRPTLLIENKAQYAKYLHTIVDHNEDTRTFVESSSAFPMIKVSYDLSQSADATILTYGEMTDLALEVSEQLMLNEEMMINVISLTQISPINYTELLNMLVDEKKIVTLEEGTVRAGWGSEVIANLSEMISNAKFLRIGASNCVLPTNKEIENMILPNTSSVYDKIKGWV